MRVRRMAAAGFGALGLALAVSAAAWACTAFSASTTLSRAFGAAGDEVMVSGTNFSGSEAAAIHWGSAKGPVLATTRGHVFSVPVTIPADASGDVFYVVAVGFDREGDPIEVAQTFEVTSASAAGPEQPLAAAAVSRDLWLTGQSSQALSDPAAGSEGIGMALGIGLLSAGLVVLAGGATVATVARRRAAASATK